MTDLTASSASVLLPEPGPVAAPAHRGRLAHLPKGLTFGGPLLLLMTVVALMAPVLSPYDPFALYPPLQAPGGAHLLGTDSLGHDVLSNLLYGARVSLAFAFGAAFVSFVLGVLVGAFPTYFGRWVDDLASRAVEVYIMVPNLFLIITAVALLGANIVIVIIIVGVTIWPANAKIMRAQVLTIKHRQYVEAGQIAGLRTWRILFRHVIPNGIGPVIANSSLQMAFAVLTEAGLSFLGLGDPNQPSWGQLLNDGQSYLDTAPGIVLAPGVALMILLLTMHSVGDGLAQWRSVRKEPGA